MRLMTPQNIIYLQTGMEIALFYRNSWKYYLHVKKNTEKCHHIYTHC